MSLLDDTLEPMTTDEVKASIYEVIALTGVDITAWKPGAVARTMIAAAALILSSLTVIASLIGKSVWLTYARGFWLTLLAQHWYGVEREVATFGRAQNYKVTNLGGGVYDFDPFQLVVTNLDTKKSYRNVAALHIGSSEVVQFEIESVESGAASTSTVGTITRVEGFDDLQGTNLESVVCLDEENDQDLIARCEATRGARSPKGTRDAYELVARAAKRSDGTRAGVNRVRTVKDGYGNVYVYLASATGGVDGTVGDLSTDLGAVADALQRQAAPLGITVIARSASELTLNFTYTAWIRDDSGLKTEEAKQLIAQELAGFINKLPIGGVKLDDEAGRVFLDTLRAAMTQSIPPDSVWHIAISSPLTDPVLNAGDVAMVGTVTGTVFFTNQNVVNSN